MSVDSDVTDSEETDLEDEDPDGWYLVREQAHRLESNVDPVTAPMAVALDTITYHAANAGPGSAGFAVTDIGDPAVNLQFSPTEVQQVVRSLRNYMVPSHRYVITIDDTYHYTLSPDFIRRVLNDSEWNAILSNAEDYPFVTLANRISRLSISIADRAARRAVRAHPGRPRGVRRLPVRPIPQDGFLPYQLTEYVMEKVAAGDDDFKHLQQTWLRYVPVEDSGIDCVGHALRTLEREGRAPPGTFDRYVAFRMNNFAFNMRQRDYRPLARALGIHIILVSDRNHEAAKRYPAERSDAPTVRLATVENHAFICEDTDYTSFSVRTDGGFTHPHLERISGLQYPVRRYVPERDRYRVMHNRPGMASHRWLKSMIANTELTEPMSAERQLTAVHTGKQFTVDYDCLCLTDGFGKPQPHVAPNEQKHATSPFRRSAAHGAPEYGRVFADFETYTRGGVHLVADMLVVQVGELQRSYAMHGPDDRMPTENFLIDLLAGIFGPQREWVVVFHNLGFDINFIVQQVPDIQIDNRIATSSSKLKCMMVRYKGMRLYFKDSYSVIPMALSRFAKTFGLTDDFRKGDCPHAYFTEDTVFEQTAPVADAVKCVRDEEEFLQSIAEFRCAADPGRYDHRRHRLVYCQQDVRILAQGYAMFREWASNLFNEELDYVVSIPQLAFNHAYNSNVFEGVCSVTGVAQAYLKNFIFGGRCMTAGNQKFYAQGVQDLDANSLYPSAMVRWDFRVPKGKPVQLTSEQCVEFDVEEWADFFITIMVNNVEVNDLDFPLLRDKKIGYHNIPQPNQRYHVSKTYLLELIRWIGIDYTVLGGIAFAEIVQPNPLAALMNGLFIERSRLKAEGQASELLVKLVMNSTYGRMIMKPVEYNETWFFGTETTPMADGSTIVDQPHWIQVQEPRPRGRPRSLLPKRRRAASQLHELTGGGFIDNEAEASDSDDDEDDELSDGEGSTLNGFIDDDEVLLDNSTGEFDNWRDAVDEQLFDLEISNDAAPADSGARRHPLIRLFNNEKFERFIKRHYHFIQEITTFGNKACVRKHRSVLLHKNYAPVGINILDSSKVIMNEVMVTAQQHGIRIFYQDTDSMHMLDQDVEMLSDTYRNVFGRELLGKSMGQFSTDFKCPPLYHNPIASESYFVGKKAYVDVVVSYLKEFDEQNPQPLTHKHTHFRLKGIPTRSVLDYCEQNYCDELELYQKLYNGERIRFDMLARNGISFQFSKTFDVTSRSTFFREVQFN